MNTKYKESLDFVVRHYRPGAFVPSARFATRRLRLPLWAAACAAGILVASACVCTIWLQPHEEQAAPSPTPAVEQPVADSHAAVRRIEFNNATLSEVIAATEECYGVRIGSVTPQEAELRLTLSYEGTAEDLVATINDLLDTNLTIESNP